MINAPAELLDKYPLFRLGLQLERVHAELGMPLCKAPVVAKDSSS